MNIRKFVITGGPCVGKTSVINELKKKGFCVIPEVARKIIDEQLACNGKIVPWINLDEFNREVVKEQVRLESSIPESFLEVFLDRGLGDNIAYYAVDGKQPIKEIVESSENADYQIVFLLDRLNLYEKDNVRKEDEEKAKKLHEEIEKAYLGLSFIVVKVPAFSVKKRVRFILDAVKKGF